jgi:hypothetical protein
MSQTKRLALLYIHIFPSHFAAPMGQLHSWLLSSDAYGIFHASFDYLTKFFPYEKSIDPHIRYTLVTT